LVILRGYRPHIFRFLLASFGDAELAKTLTERCTEIAFHKWTGGDDQSLSRKSLMRVAVNLERRHWLKHQLHFWRKTEVKTAGLAHLNSWLPNDQLSIEDQIGARGNLKRVWHAVCGLSNEQKIVFLLHCVDEMTSSEIAEVADLHEWTVRALLAEALSIIRVTGSEEGTIQ
jgi:RNA polymerase sigma-70 factor, ECF subfamily